jgi:hypothetical protein
MFPVKQDRRNPDFIGNFHSCKRFHTHYLIYTYITKYYIGIFKLSISFATH